MSFFRKIKQIGPGAMVAAAFIGPGTVTTATISGASYGYTLLWAILFSIFATSLLQEMSARLGFVAKVGVGEALRGKMKSPVLKWLGSGLVISAILIGNAAYEAGNVSGAVLGFDEYLEAWPLNPLIILIGLLAFLLLFTGKYVLIERFLIGLVALMGFVFLVAAILLKPSLIEFLRGIFIPTLPAGSLLLVVGLIGTTVVPYNLFLHASSVKTKWQNGGDLSTVRFDTILSILFGGLITMAILVTAAIAFAGTQQEIENIGGLAHQLKPILGAWSQTFIALGFLAAGFTSAITAPLAAAFATSEILGWKSGLQENKFRGIWIFVLFCGLIFSSLGFKPTAVILFAQVANGLLLPIVAIFLLWIMNDKSLLGRSTNGPVSNLFGMMVVLVTMILGYKGIWNVTQILVR